MSTGEDIKYAWELYGIGAVRVAGECVVRMGLGLDGSEIEIVGALLENGEWLAYHAMTPLTKEMMHEIACAQRRL